MFDKVYLIKSISAVTNYNSSSCLLKITLFQQVYPNKPHGPPKMISLIQLLNEGPKEDSWTLKKPINYIFVDHFIKKR